MSDWKATKTAPEGKLVLISLRGSVVVIGRRRGANDWIYASPERVGSCSDADVYGWLDLPQPAPWKRT